MLMLCNHFCWELQSTPSRANHNLSHVLHVLNIQWTLMSVWMVNEFRASIGDILVPFRFFHYYQYYIGRDGLWTRMGGKKYILFPAASAKHTEQEQEQAEKKEAKIKESRKLININLSHTFNIHLSI